MNGGEMQTVARAIKRAGVTGEPLPEVYPCLTKAQILFRRGGTSMIGAWPGSYKSTLALNLAKSWAEQGMIILYISADSDEITVAKRMAAIITGDRMVDVEKTLRSGAYAEQLHSLKNIHWEFKALSIDQLDERLVAIKKMHGRFPDLIVVDNLLNMLANPTDYSGQMTYIRDLDQVARAASSHVLVLHHTHEASMNKKAPATPQAVWELHGRLAHFPRLILTLAAAVDQETESAHLMVACVKNTNGPGDRTGQTYEDFIIDTPSARIQEVPHV
jgi:RecA-family ATPase